MCNYNKRFIKAKLNLDQRLMLERRTREDGKRYAIDYFALNKENMVDEVLNSLISYMEDENQCETYFETAHIIQNEKYFEQTDAYRAGFKEKILELMYNNISKLIPDFINYCNIIINEHYTSYYNEIHIIVTLNF